MMSAPENAPVSMSAWEDLQLATDPGTAPDRLAELATGGDRELRRAVAGNPNAPRELLYKLGADCPEAFLANPALLLFLLEDPNLSERMPLATLRVLARYETLPVAMIAGAARRGDFQIEQALAANPQTPASVLQDLADRPADCVREAARLHITLAGELPADTDWRDRAYQATVASLQQGRTEALLRPYVPMLLLDWLSACQAPILREAVAKNSIAPPHLLARLAADPVLQVRKAVAGHPAAPPTVLINLSRDGHPDLLAALAANPRVPVELLERLARETVATLRLKAMGPAGISGDLLAKLARAQWTILTAIVQNPQASPLLLAELLAALEAIARQVSLQPAPCGFVRHYAPLRWHIAMHPNTSEADAEGLFGPEPLVRIGRFFESVEPIHPGVASFGILKQVAGHPRAPRYVLAQLARVSLPLQAVVARNPNAPPDLVRQWSGYPAYHGSIAPNPQIAAPLLAKLAREGDESVRRQVACNPALDTSTLATLSQDGDEGVRLNLAENPAVPASVLEQLLEDVSGRVSSAAIAPYLQQVPDGLPQVLAKSLQALSGPRDRDRRFILLFHPQMPPASLAARSRALNWLERCAIAQNPNTPQPCVERLAAEGNCIVRAAARANLRGAKN